MQKGDRREGREKEPKVRKHLLFTDSQPLKNCLGNLLCFLCSHIRAWMIQVVVVVIAVVRRIILLSLNKRRLEFGLSSPTQPHLLGVEAGEMSLALTRQALPRVDSTYARQL